MRVNRAEYIRFPKHDGLGSPRGEPRKLPSGASLFNERGTATSAGAAPVLPGSTELHSLGSELDARWQIVEASFASGCLGVPVELLPVAVALWTTPLV